MKGAAIFALALGVPLVLMFLISAGGKTPLPPQAASPTKTSQTSARSALPPSVAPTRAIPHSDSTEPFNLTESIEQWVEPWRDRLKASPDSDREAAAADLVAGRYERAAKTFDRLLTQTPNDADLLRGEAIALCKLGRYDDALPLLASAVELQPADSATRFQYAVALTRLNQREQAVACLQQLLANTPHHDRARFALAVLQQSVGQQQAALATWRQLTHAVPATQPDHSNALDPAMIIEAFFHQGEVAMSLDQAKEASECFRQVTQRRPDDAVAWCNLGIALAAFGQNQDAITALNEALRIKADLVPAINQLAFIYAAHYRDHHESADRDRVTELCQRSLTIQSFQPNIIALRNSALGVEWTTTAPTASE